MASAWFGGDVDLVLSKARPTASVPGRRSVSEGFQLTPASQPHLSSRSWRSRRGQQEGGRRKEASDFSVSLTRHPLFVISMNIVHTCCCFIRVGLFATP